LSEKRAWNNLALDALAPEDLLEFLAGINGEKIGGDETLTIW